MLRAFAPGPGAIANGEAAAAAKSWTRFPAAGDRIPRQRRRHARGIVTRDQKQATDSGLHGWSSSKISDRTPRSEASFRTPW